VRTFKVNIYFCAWQIRVCIIYIYIFPTLTKINAQHTYIPNWGLSQHILERLEIKSGEIANCYFHSSVKSYKRKSISLFIENLKSKEVDLSNQDSFNICYLKNDNFEWIGNNQSYSNNFFLKSFYNRKAAFYSVQTKDFNLVVNPVFCYQISTDRFKGKAAVLNNRGIEIRGNVGHNIGFYTQISDEILRPNSWVGEYYFREGPLMYANFVKSDGVSLNYFLSSAYVTFSPYKFVDLKYGHSKNFIGDGYRTFVLGDMQPDYLNLSLNTHFWKINYTNIWSELRDYFPGVYNIQPRHYTVTNHLSFNLFKNFNVGFFETILFHRDSGNFNTGFSKNYLNPIIFYKTLENGFNGPDKAIIGLNYKCNFSRHFSLYGQFVFSEFKLNELLSANGWWGNNYAFQTGLKYIDFFNVNNFDLQGEFNYARPYSFTSNNPSQSFSNFGQFMGHPLGSNFYEVLLILRFQPIYRLYLNSKFIYTLYGNDTNSSNWGKDIRKGNNSRQTDYGNFVGQGILTKLFILDLMASYMIGHNFFLDLKFGYRKTIADLPLFESMTAYFSFGVRLNFNYRNYDF
jgi:hypothetical protein